MCCPTESVAVRFPSLRERMLRQTELYLTSRLAPDRLPGLPVPAVRLVRLSAGPWAVRRALWALSA
jgi:hypothetical protein